MPIRDAKVSHRVFPCRYGPGGIRGTRDVAKIDVGLPYVPVDHDGEVSLPRVSKWGLGRLWWPLMVPGGWTEYHGHENEIVADAPGYRPRIVWFTPGASDPLRGLPLAADGTLVLRLGRR
jgi:hypothetical protein